MNAIDGIGPMRCVRNKIPYAVYPRQYKYKVKRKDNTVDSNQKNNDLRSSMASNTSSSRNDKSSRTQQN